MHPATLCLPCRLLSSLCSATVTAYIASGSGLAKRVFFFFLSFLSHISCVNFPSLHQEVFQSGRTRTPNEQYIHHPKHLPFPCGKTSKVLPSSCFETPSIVLLAVVTLWENTVTDFFFSLTPASHSQATQSQFPLPSFPSPYGLILCGGVFQTVHRVSCAVLLFLGLDYSSPHNVL